MPRKSLWRAQKGKQGCQTLSSSLAKRITVIYECECMTVIQKPWCICMYEKLPGRGGVVHVDHHKVITPFFLLWAEDDEPKKLSRRQRVRAKKRTLKEEAKKANPPKKMKMNAKQKGRIFFSGTVMNEGIFRCFLLFQCLLVVFVRMNLRKHWKSCPQS